MRLPGRAAAAIEVLTEVMDRHRPASDALRDWGKAHRFAGSGDRHVIGTLVYDALRNRNLAAAMGGAETPRAIILGTLAAIWKLPVDEIKGLAAEQHGCGPLTDAEITALKSNPVGLPAHVIGSFPEWLTPQLTEVFGENVAEEMAALAARAPIDLRVNTLRTNRSELLKELSRFGAIEGPLSPWSVRIAAPDQHARHISVEAEPSHGRGLFEVQDSASQVAALLSGVSPGERVADICAGAGGKTLALAAMMQNQGVLVAHDTDRRRLRPIFERITRAGASCIEVLAAEDGKKLETYGGFDCVVIDAPCSGSGAWRRKPETKWKLKPATLEQRIRDQREVLVRGARLVKPGGRLEYITCSVLPSENTKQVAAFLQTHREFELVPYAEQWQKVCSAPPPLSADGSMETLLLTPRQHATDGFFVALFRRKS